MVCWIHMIICPQEEMEVVTISGYQDVPQNDESLLKALAHQPLSVAIEASGRDFQFYSGVSWIISYIFSPQQIKSTLFDSYNLFSLIMLGFVGFAGRVQWPLRNWARSWSNSCWIWVIEGVRLHHREEFMGTQMGRGRVHNDEEKHRQTRRALRYQQIGFISYQIELIYYVNFSSFHVFSFPRLIKFYLYDLLMFLQ